MRSIAPPQRSIAPRVSFPQLVNLLERTLLSGKTTIHPAEFFARWIAKIYGVYPDEQNYRQACLAELMTNLNGVVTRESIIGNWRWEGEKQQYPNYLPVMLFQIHLRYCLLDALNLLPRRSLYREET